MKDGQITEAWSAFVRNAVGELNNQQVADRIGVSDTTVGNWINGKNFTRPNAQNVVDCARAFGQPIPKALAAAGVVEAHEFDEIVTVRRTPDEMSNDEILEAMVAMVATLRDREHPQKKTRKKIELKPRPEMPPY